MRFFAHWLGVLLVVVVILFAASAFALFMTTTLIPTVVKAIILGLAIITTLAYVTYNE